MSNLVNSWFGLI